jgi:hypothetical protein
MRRFMLLVYISVLLWIVAMLSGCSITPKFISGTKAPAEEAASVDAHAKVLPKVYYVPETLKDGERVIGVVVANEVKKSYSAEAGKKAKEIKYTLWQRILRGMMGWGIIAIVAFIALGLAAPWLTTAVFAWLKSRWKKFAMSTAKGLEAANVKDNSLVAGALEQSQPQSVKDQVKKLREEGKLNA